MEVFHEAGAGRALNLAGLSLGLSLCLLVLAALIGSLKPTGALSNRAQSCGPRVHEVMLVSEQSEDMSGGTLDAVAPLVPTPVSTAHF
jgi:glycerol uptake facilitator-like aquaporin